MKIANTEVIVKSKDHVKVGCTTVTRNEALEVISMMDSYNVLGPSPGDIMRFDGTKGSFQIVVSASKQGTVVWSSHESHKTGDVGGDWNWYSVPQSWTNLGPLHKCISKEEPEPETNLEKHPTIGDVMYYNTIHENIKVLVSGHKSGSVVTGNVKLKPIGTYRTDWSWPSMWWTNLGQ